MAKHIVINRCSECVHFKRGGGFGAIRYVPRCGKENHVLEYTLRNGDIAVVKDYIPEWCPLDNVPALPDPKIHYSATIETEYD